MTSARFSGQVAIITGGASGIGLAIARRLQAEQAEVIIFDIAREPPVHLRNDLARGLTYKPVDVTDESAVYTAVSEIERQSGHIDVLVNSAGITGKTNIKSHEVEPGDFERVMRLNVHGPFLTSKHVLPVMLKADYGRILHIASIAGKEGNAGMLAYSASKAALIGMTKVQGKDYASAGITINALAPAVVRTPIVEALPPAQVAYMTSRIPMNRCGTLDEVAAMGAFIVSREASFTTGFTFDLTGGRAVY